MTRPSVIQTPAPLFTRADVPAPRVAWLTESMDVSGGDGDEVHLHEYIGRRQTRHRGTVSWQPTAPDLAAAFAAHVDPLAALARADIPAILLRGVYPAADCRGLIARFVERGLMRDPDIADPLDRRTRIDIGTSLGNLGGDQEAFLTDAAATRALFATLFDGFADPAATLYGQLQALAGDKQVKTAREPNGRLYGPAIFRVHYDSHAYRPHIDHVVLREKRFDYAVSRFAQQFAGVLCVQNADAEQPGVHVEGDVDTAAARPLHLLQRLGHRPAA